MFEMSEAAKKARREYQREWRKQHPDKVKQYAKNQWENYAFRKFQAEVEEAKKPGG